MSHKAIGQIVSRAYAKLQRYDPDNVLLRFVRGVDMPTGTPLFSAEFSSEFRSNYMNVRVPEAERSFTALWNYFMDMAKEISNHV